MPAGVADGPSVAIDIEVAGKTTFAAVQNAVPILRQVAVRNGTPAALDGLRLRMEAQPEFCRPKEWRVERVDAGERLAVSELGVSMNFETLDRLDETERGELRFALWREDRLLAERVVAIELLARDHWGGAPEMPQILAAFVFPNHMQTARLLKEASRLLEAAGHSGALNGYQDAEPARAYMLAAAIWSAATGMGLSYAEPPKSFESQGQKIRDPGRIAETGLATCLDTALLLAGAIEQAGLNPAVVFTKEHAFVGVWLGERSFPTTVECDVTEIRKAIAAQEFVAFETTLLTQKPAVPFDRALAAAKEQLSERREDEFRWMIDIARARAAGIRPLSRGHARDDDAPVRGKPADPAAPAPLPEALEIDPIIAESMLAEERPSTPQDRIQRWQERLLDLSLRNRLLNFSATKKTLPLICPDVPALEDALAEGQRFKIISLADEDPVGHRDPQAYRQETGGDIEADFAADAMRKNQICAPIPRKDMQARLVTLYREARADLAEGGANTLFIALGFLRWKKSDSDARAYRAPLLLMPVKLSRRSAQSSYYLSHHEDDIQFNQTLLQMLERDFELRVPELQGELPTDHSGLDIARIFQTMRQAVREVPGFELAEDVALSTFSFAKYLMWKDLVERTDSLRDNRLVRHLIDNPDAPFASGGSGMLAAEDIDRSVAPEKLFAPLPADSSQLAVVVAAERGEDFVVIGPPGTGKSQTITNIMAHCLANGKTVLFVAEKSAALDVVHRRLKACGLADACLELHSNKAERTAVIQQLGRAWERATDGDEASWHALASDLTVSRGALNGYVDALHRKGAHGFSVYDAIGAVAGQTPGFALSFTTRDAHDRDSYLDLEALAERAGRAAEVIAGCDALESVRHTEWSFAWQSALLASVSASAEAARAAAEAARAFEDALGLATDADMSAARQSLLARLAEAVGRAGDGDFRAACGSDPGSLAASVDGLAATIDNCRIERSRLRADYADAEIARMPLDELDRDWRRANAGFWPFSALGRRRVRKLLGSYAAAGRAEPAAELAPLGILQDCLAAIKASPLTALPDYRGGDSDPDALRAHLSIAAALRESVEALRREAERAGGTAVTLDEVAAEGGWRGEIAAQAAAFRVARDALDERLAAYGRQAGGALETPSLAALGATLAAIEADSGRLADWLKWVAVRDQAKARGLGPLLDALGAGAVGDARTAFRVAYFHWWLPLAIDADERLRGFVHWEHEDAVRRLRQVIEAIQQMTAAQVRGRIAHGLPAKGEVAKNSELGFLRHQLGLKRPRTSIRQLLAKMPETMTRLTPCVLMSPLSVAQYLPADQALFDIVIFDEASQITTWDAIGAIARGRQSIIVGDPKQLPPTNFFGRAERDDEDEDLAFYEKDLSSILEEAIAAGLPTQRLKWHYRSRDEALIAFSNHHYYGDQLITFPSPGTRANAVRLHLVNGAYARGSGRTNQVEARAVVAFAVERLKSWLGQDEADRKSLGVITFNMQQRELILDLLDAERRQEPALEWFFADDREQPVIVKNLENIQGDERDVMLFSITFGPDKAGKLSMSFGAVNHDGGERRLNVAVTRAREELHVFSSVTADMIDLARAKGLGVAHLKNFLDYAERGASALPSMDEGSLGPAESPFEAAVAEALRAKGWEVRTQIGVSGFRVDLGVIDPDRAGAYLAGIECDGASYHRAASARDRDQIREAVLRDLGWEILRIWSTDWFMHEQETLKRVDGQLRALLDNARSRR